MAIPSLTLINPAPPELEQWNERIVAWMESPNSSELAQQVENGMAEFLCAVKCWCSLVNMYNLTDPESPPRRLVIARMREKIKLVTGDNTPMWFSRSLKNQIDAPPCLALDLRIKAVQLFRQDYS